MDLKHKTVLPFNSNFAVDPIAEFLKRISDNQIKSVTCSKRTIEFELKGHKYTLKLIKHK